MKHSVIRFSAALFCTTVGVGCLAGCSHGGIFATSSALPEVTESQSHYVNGHFVPHWSAFATLVPPELRPFGGAVSQQFTPDVNAATSAGVYASEVYATDIWGYPANNAHNGKAICAEPNVSGPNGIAVDGSGNLIDPDGGTHAIVVFKGPRMCGAQLGSVSDPYGQPADAASANAATGTIVVANIFDNNKAPGSVTRCTLAHGCKTNLSNSNMYEVGGVALAKNGDCWASATNSSGKATLIYFKSCAGSGKKAIGYRNASYGGLDIDLNGNLVSLSAFDQKLYVYKGCNPKCILVGGPFAMHGEATFGHLNQTATKFVAGDFQYGQVDVYSYSPRKLKFGYGFNKGFNPSELVEGAAYNPRSTE